MPPPVVCLTCPAASPATMNLGDQHLSTGPEIRTLPDFVASILDFGQCSFTSWSRSVRTFPFEVARPALTLRSPVGMLHAKNPGALLEPTYRLTRSSCLSVPMSSDGRSGR